MASENVKTYPLVKMERLAAPPDIPGLRMRGAQVHLWRRLRRSLRWVGIGTAALVTAVVLGITTDVNAGATAPVFALALFASIIVLPLSLIATLRTLRIAWRLRTTPWRSYDIDKLQMPREQPVTMTLVEGKTFYPVKIRVSKRAESLRGLGRPQVWFAGDPAKLGLLTVAGGGDILWAHPNPTRPRRPRKVKPVDPEKAKRRAAKIAARNAKAAARAKAWAAKHPPKPRKPAKPQPVRKPVLDKSPPRIPKIRGGTKIKWQ